MPDIHPINSNKLLFSSGEHIKTWRPRYFTLLSDGRLYGYRKPPGQNDSQQEEPLNKFQVTDCSVIRQDKIKQNAFVIHFNQMKIERLFAASNQQDRYEEKNLHLVYNSFYIF